MSEELDVLKEVARHLERAGIAYMITGSIAANFYTVPRMTRDINIVAELGEQDVTRFISLFENDYYLDRQTVEQAVRTKGMFNLISISMLSRSISWSVRTVLTVAGNSPGGKGPCLRIRKFILWRRRI
jgi:hypothetical protein